MVTGPGGEPCLLLRFHSLGDVVLATGVARELAHRGPLTIATERRYRPVFVPLFRDEQVVDRETVAAWPAAASPPFARVVDLQGTVGTRRLSRRLGERSDRINTRAAARRWIVAWGDRFPRPGVPTVLERYAAAAGLAPDRPQAGGGPRVEVSDDECAHARTLAPEAFDATRPAGVALVTGASRRTKRWPEASFVELAGRLRAAGLAPWWLEDPAAGHADEDADAPPRPAALTGVPRWRLPLSALKAVLARASLVIACDSGPMHLAAALGTPTLALFTSTVPAFGFAPDGPHTRLLQADDLACRPCSVHGRKRCWLGHWRCQRDLTPGRVAEEAFALLQSACPRTMAGGRP